MLSILASRSSLLSLKKQTARCNIVSLSRRPTCQESFETHHSPADYNGQWLHCQHKHKKNATTDFPTSQQRPWKPKWPNATTFFPPHTGNMMAILFQLCKKQNPKESSREVRPHFFQKKMLNRKKEFSCCWELSYNSLICNSTRRTSHRSMKRASIPSKKGWEAALLKEEDRLSPPLVVMTTNPREAQ